MNNLIKSKILKINTPFWLYDKAIVLKRINSLKAFDTIRYAQKANSNIQILKIMRENQIIVDAVSLGEIERAHFAEDTIYRERFLKEFFEIENEQKLKLNSELRFTSDGASHSTIKNLYQRIYINKFKNKIDKVEVINSIEVVGVEQFEEKINIICENKIKSNTYAVESDFLIFCTGFTQEFKQEILDQNILDLIEFDHSVIPKINSDFSIQYNGIGKIYLVNGSKHAFGVVEPNLSLNAFRAKRIIDSVLCQYSLSRESA